ncbi:hypothetical protein CTA1_12775 [Colletotrichum tanaceti]|uniref:Uncharacterized protein n=1 Tax=Colletotrichum tanaceti TaxID=1306861 RepID=A0A4U6XI39_9PEZI|nr:hypothetical protein CTA1_12775 [Colletotrichum tanaceti]
MRELALPDVLRRGLLHYRAWTENIDTVDALDGLPRTGVLSEPPDAETRNRGMMVFLELEVASVDDLLFHFKAVFATPQMSQLTRARPEAEGEAEGQAEAEEEKKDEPKVKVLDPWEFKGWAPGGKRWGRSTIAVLRIPAYARNQEITFRFRGSWASSPRVNYE